MKCPPAVHLELQEGTYCALDDATHYAIVAKYRYLLKRPAGTQPAVALVAKRPLSVETQDHLHLGQGPLCNKLEIREGAAVWWAGGGICQPSGRTSEGEKGKGNVQQRDGK